jgi:predicted CopG family antitoxin
LVAKETSSPFTPGIPVPIEFFVGRLQEINQLRQRLTNAASGRIEVGFLAGERGIGKSSLAAFARTLFERQHRALGVHAFLGGVTRLDELARTVFDRLLKVSAEKSWSDKIRELFGKHVKTVDLFGINMEFAAETDDLQRLVHGFAPAFRAVIDRLRPELSVTFLVLDDINGLAAAPAFANWLKSLVDEIATSQAPLPLLLLLVGMEERRQELLRVQPSLARVLDVIEIRPWSADETGAFFVKAFQNVAMAIEPAALDLLVEFAGGLPVFAHEIGDAAFNCDTDKRIDTSDADSAITTAAAIIGRKYLEPQVVAAVRSPRYRSILRRLARDSLSVRFQRGDVLKRLSSEEQRVFDNLLRRMTKLGVICRDPEEGPGAYRFTRQLHQVYFWMEAERLPKNAPR